MVHDSIKKVLSRLAQASAESEKTTMELTANIVHKQEKPKRSSM